MSSARKRAAIHKANREADHLRQRLMLAEHHGSVMESFARVAAARSNEMLAALKGARSCLMDEITYHKADAKKWNDEVNALLTLAEDAHEAWDKDEDARVGKLLLAMMDATFRKTYRPDLAKVGGSDTATPNASLEGCGAAGGASLSKRLLGTGYERNGHGKTD